MSDDKVILTVEQAVSLLPDGEYIHNYANPNGMLIGVDYTRADALKTLKEAKQLELGGAGCQGMGHGLVCWHTERRHTFFETDRAKVKAFEAALSAPDSETDEAGADFIHRRCQRFNEHVS